MANHGREKELEDYIRQISQYVVRSIEDPNYHDCSFRYLIYTILDPPLSYMDGMSLGLLDLNNALMARRLPNDRS